MRALVCLVLVACGRSPDECRTEANALGALLEAAAAEPPSLTSIDSALTPVLRTDLTEQVKQMAPVVMMGKTETTYQGQVVTEVALKEPLAAARARIQDELELGKTRRQWVPEPRRVYFVIDAAVPGARVARAFESAHEAGMTAVGFIFASPQPVKRPPRSPIDDKLDKLVADESGNKATEIARMLEERVRDCPPLIRLFGAVGADEGGNKAMTIAKGVGPALIECGCRVNVPEVRSLVFRVMYVDRPTRALLLDPDQPAEPIQIGANETWADISKRMPPTLKNARFELK